ncbi:class I adenylate-forming enzyme family protein [Halioxenophilus sp. WMMB6]|uniref:class I adenylate-forming enzyme family protein n=1 Tax=Halioxenophilus sp. WMMB6 TaxID=3073815 RepID=UPI00295E25C5|nr:class I adenylate-forming enzyme family protein [Halioxenophilus sp. WMMB6]
MKQISEFTGIPLAQEDDIGAITLPSFIQELAQRFEQREAVTWTSPEGIQTSWSYLDILQRSQQVAKALLSRGVTKGTRIGILISNRPEWLFCLFGASMAGATVVALNTFSTVPELKYQLKVADVAHFFFEAGIASRDFNSDLKQVSPTLFGETANFQLDPELPFLRSAICVDPIKASHGTQNWEEFLSTGDGFPDELVTAAASTADPVDDSLIFFSSGTTALPKAIRQTHRAATLQCWRTAKMFEFSDTERTWNANGYFFSGNFAMAFGTLCRGGCIVMLRYFDPEAAIELIEKQNVTSVIAWPHQEARLKDCKSWETADFSKLRRVVAGSPFRDHPSTNITWPGFNGYGMTETFTFVTVISGKAMEREGQGPVLPGNIVRIVDPETGVIVPIGQSGEIIVKGPTLTPGYLKYAPEDTFDREGFIHTADAGYFTGDGYLYWSGRLSDIIKTGGANVSPTEIDSIICQHPSVQTSHTVGIPDDSLGELVVSCVVAKEGHNIQDDEVRAFCKSYLSGYKIPRKVLFFDESDLPKTGSNKIKTSALRELAGNRLHQTS